MTAMQTLMSASLVALLAASTGTAHAEPEDDAPPRPASQAPPGTPTGSFQLGAGYATDEGFLTTATIAQDDLFDTGKRLELTARLSERGQLFRLRYEDPSVGGTRFMLRGDLYSTRRSFVGFDREATGGALTLSRPLGKHLHAFLGYKLEQVTVTPTAVAPSARGVADEPAWRGGRIAALRAGLVYSTLDTPWLPTRGTSVGGVIEVADRDLGSEIGYTRTDAWLSHHRPLGPLTLHLGGTLRTITGSAPLSERLHFDGSRMIRGYAPGAIGPHDPVTGMPLGGTLAYTARGELEAPLSSRLGLSAAGFVDVGGIYDDHGGASAGSAGVGLIWRTPIGPVRLDVAFPLDGGKPRLVFGLGGGF